MTQISAIKRIMLKAKLRLPFGTKLDARESDWVIDQWKGEKKAVALRAGTLEDSANAIDRHVAKVKDAIPEAAEAMREARINFKKVKSPIAKEKWARKLIVRSKYHAQLRHSQQTMIANSERVRDAIDDAKVVFNMLSNRISEAEIYRELNGCLHLVGKALVEARKQHQSYDVETNNLEVSMESIETEVAGGDRKQLLLEASNIEKSLTKGGDK